MIRTLYVLVLLISGGMAFCQEQDNEKHTQLSLFPDIQLSSTGWNGCLIAKVECSKNIFYAGVKTPVMGNNLYGYFPVGLIAGYGYKLIQNGKWEMAPLLDAQWLSSKTQNLIKPTHYFDFTLNYQVTYKMTRKIHLASSFGYGLFLKEFYRRDLDAWQNSEGIGGLISLGIVYVL
jgi:hypothetical protein